VGSSLVGSVVEAWQELRIHRTRVLLSLIGVAVAVCAITAVVGLGALAEQASVEQIERSSGRPATLYVSASSTGTETLPQEDITAAFDAAAERYSVDYTTRSGYSTQDVQFADGVVPVNSILVDVPYGTIHRVQLSEGSWFTDLDARRLAPAVIVNRDFWERLGSPDLATHPTVPLLGAKDTVGVIVGVSVDVYDYGDQEYLEMYELYDAHMANADPSEAQNIFPSYEMWVPEDLSADLIPLLQRDIGGALGDDVQVNVDRQDYLGGAGEDPFASIKLLVAGVAALVLLLGALGLVNISLVTVKQRVREIGIRRSFGATAGRVFFSVMMESIVATVAAGIAGVMLAVVIVQNPWIQERLAPGIMDTPPFPVDAALLGLACATGVGALAGLLPALVAVRVKVIDAIRF
jgi:putative ABC transport system permease protein